MDEYNIYEGAFSGPQIDSILGNSTRQDAIAIVSSNNTHIAITAGQYVYVKSHETLAEGLYKANSNISANATLTSSNLTAVSNGGLNELKSAFSNISDTNYCKMPDGPMIQWGGGYKECSTLTSVTDSISFSPAFSANPRMTISNTGTSNPQYAAIGLKDVITTGATFVIYNNNQVAIGVTYSWIAVGRWI